MPKPPKFRDEDKIRMLLWCARHCCLCGKNAGPDIEIAHISNKAGNDIDNGIPLCYNCHATIGHYNREHPRGNKYKADELKARREQIYEEQTRKLVPPIHFYLSQTRVNNTQHQLPFVGFRLNHMADSLPVKVRVEARVILGTNDQGILDDPSGYYNGNTLWHINPRTIYWGGFSISQVQSTEGDLKIEVRLTIIDAFEREHRLLPQSWRFVRTGTPPFWNLEPRSFTNWT